MAHENINEFSDNLMVIDTDAGSDDALALILALGNPNWKIVAITTVFGNIEVDVAYDNVLRILNLCNQTNIPVYKGSEGSLLYPTESDHYHGPDGFGGNAHLYSLPQDVIKTEEHACNALIRLAKQYPKMLSLVTLGPLTNLALAHRLDQNFSSNLKDVVIMGGNIYGKGNVTPCAEFNFLCDPDSADIVLREFNTNMEITPWETCATHLSPWDWFERWISLGTKKSNFAAKITASAVYHCRKVTNRTGYNCCDLLAMTAKMYPHLVSKKERRHVQVETQGKTSRGMMIVEWRNHVNVTPNVDICLEFDMEGVRNVWDEMLK